ncbi:MAG: hypothetical protein KDA66_14955 [Planctomycetaceae bacterium]|nr:hypothetical protein [Planctomycetaceae bacterium]
MPAAAVCCNGWSNFESALKHHSPQAAQKLSNYIRSRLAETDYPRYRSRGWTIGSGMVESSAKQLVGLRLKGPGMHWSRAGATALTALRCAHLNGHWHQTWQNLTLTG